MTPLQFKRWLTKATPGDEIVYFNTAWDRDMYDKQFDAARRACDKHQVILFQRHAGDGWEYVARRVSDKAAGWLERMENWHEDLPERKALVRTQCARLAHPKRLLVTTRDLEMI